MSRKAKLRRMYDTTSAFYDDLYEKEQVRKFEAISRCVDLSFPKDGVVLDAGCGTGLITQRLQSLRRFIVGVDFSEGMLKRAKERLRERNTDFVLSDIERLPFRSKSFDLILCLTVLQNCNPLKALKSLLKVLTNKGLLVLSYFKRSKNMALIESLLDNHILRDVDTTDNVLILNRRAISILKRARDKKVLVKSYGLSGQGVA